MVGVRLTERPKKTIPQYLLFLLNVNVHTSEIARTVTDLGGSLKIPRVRNTKLVFGSGVAFPSNLTFVSFLVARIYSYFCALLPFLKKYPQHPQHPQQQLDPLCKFLGKPIPDGSFPHVHDRVKLEGEMFVVRGLTWIWPAVLIYIPVFTLLTFKKCRSFLTPQRGLSLSHGSAWSMVDKVYAVLVGITLAIVYVLMLYCRQWNCLFWERKADLEDD